MHIFTASTADCHFSEMKMLMAPGGTALSRGSGGAGPRIGPARWFDLSPSLICDRMSFRINNFHSSVSKRCTSPCTSHPALRGQGVLAVQRPQQAGRALSSPPADAWEMCTGSGAGPPRGCRCPRGPSAWKRGWRAAREARISFHPEETLPLLLGLCLTCKNVRPEGMRRGSQGPLT